MPNQLTVLVIDVTCQTSFLRASACPVPCSVPPPPWTAESTQGDRVYWAGLIEDRETVYWAGLIEDWETVYWAGLIEDWALLLCSAVKWEKCIPNCRSALIQTLLQFHLFSFVLLSCTSLCKFFPRMFVS